MFETARDQFLGREVEFTGASALLGVAWVLDCVPSRH